MQGFIGNNAAAALLRNALLSGRGTHAYLLTGPTRIGKRTLAKRAAATLVCDAAPEERPCGECRACGLIDRNSHPDVRMTEPTEGRRGIVIEQIRQLEHASALRPYESDRKALILTEADAMTEGAANALLKTLEEPPEDTVLLLTASDPSQVLPTISSRCQEVALRPVPADVIDVALVERGRAPDSAKLLARLAGGRPGWALAAADDMALLEGRNKQVALLEELMARQPVERLPAAAGFGDSAAARATLDVWQTWWRDALLVAEGCDELLVNVDRLEALRRAGLPSAGCWQAVRRLQEAREQLDANANVRLAVEALLLDLPVSGTGERAAVR